jgi:hypothetical protein
LKEVGKACKEEVLKNKRAFQREKLEQEENFGYPRIAQAADATLGNHNFLRMYWTYICHCIYIYQWVR